MAEHDPKGAAKEAAAAEAAAKTVEILASVVLLALAVLAQRQAADPDAGRTLSMRAHRAAEGRLARLGIWALQHAERHRQAYGRLCDGH